MENCHYWDPIFRRKFFDLNNRLKQVDEEEMYKEMLSVLSQKYRGPILTLYTANPFDISLNYYPRLLVAQTWSYVRESNDWIDLFKTQLDDMISSGGYCSQGWSNRMIQILFALNILHLE